MAADGDNKNVVFQICRSWYRLEIVAMAMHACLPNFDRDTDSLSDCGSLWVMTKSDFLNDLPSVVIVPSASKASFRAAFITTLIGNVSPAILHSFLKHHDDSSAVSTRCFFLLIYYWRLHSVTSFGAVSWTITRSIISGSSQSISCQPREGAVTHRIFSSELRVASTKKSKVWFHDNLEIFLRIFIIQTLLWYPKYGNIGVDLFWNL